MGKVSGTGLRQLPLSHLLPNTPKWWGRARAPEPALLLASCVSPGGLPNFSGPQFSHL